MKTITPKLIILSFFSAIFITPFFTSCSKEAAHTIDRQTALLIEKSWKFEIYGLDENNNGVIEESENNMLACEIDDIFIHFLHFFTAKTEQRSIEVNVFSACQFIIKADA